MRYKVQLMMDNGQSKIVLIDGDSEQDVIKRLLMVEAAGLSMNKFSTVVTREYNSFTYCVGKLSTIEFLD